MSVSRWSCFICLLLSAGWFSCRLHQLKVSKGNRKKRRGHKPWIICSHMFWDHHLIQKVMWWSGGRLCLSVPMEKFHKAEMLDSTKQKEPSGIKLETLDWISCETLIMVKPLVERVKPPLLTRQTKSNWVHRLLRTLLLLLVSTLSGWRTSGGWGTLGSSQNNEKPPLTMKTKTFRDEPDLNWVTKDIKYVRVHTSKNTKIHDKRVVDLHSSSHLRLPPSQGHHLPLRGAIQPPPPKVHLAECRPRGNGFTWTRVSQFEVGVCTEDYWAAMLQH